MLPVVVRFSSLKSMVPPVSVMEPEASTKVLSKVAAPEIRPEEVMVPEVVSSWSFLRNLSSMAAALTSPSEPTISTEFTVKALEPMFREPAEIWSADIEAPVIVPPVTEKVPSVKVVASEVPATARVFPLKVRLAE